MNQEVLRERKEFLEEMMRELAERAGAFPEGSLKVNAHGKGYQYYVRDKACDGGVYISTQNLDHARALAQKKYERKVLQAAEQECTAIRGYLRKCPSKTVESIHEMLPPGIGCLVKPVCISNEEYAAQWECAKYKKKVMDAKMEHYQTSAGEIMRSKSELLIAERLRALEVPYRYEPCVKLKERRASIKVHPDFQVLNVRLRKEFYWEHFGMLDDEEYREHNLEKILLYEKNGYFPGVNLLITHETQEHPLDLQVVDMLIKEFLL